MTVSYKVLAQGSYTANTNNNLYTVPGGTQTVISTISVCNQNNISGTFSIAISPGASTLEAKHYVYYNKAIAANETINITIGITASQTDIIRVQTSLNNISFNVFGSEIF